MLSCLLLLGNSCWWALSTYCVPSTEKSSLHALSQSLQQAYQRPFLPLTRNSRIDQNDWVFILAPLLISWVILEELLILTRPHFPCLHTRDDNNNTYLIGLLCRLEFQTIQKIFRVLRYLAYSEYVIKVSYYLYYCSPFCRGCMWPSVFTKWFESCG